ncbi:MAG: hypothetical protein JWQ60_3332, partial [Pseudonocardia sp.]|nr:hypothetical protein [Pseudonocardia sp.]
RTRRAVELVTGFVATGFVAMLGAPHR